MYFIHGYRPAILSDMKFILSMLRLADFLSGTERIFFHSQTGYFVSGGKEMIIFTQSSTTTRLQNVVMCLIYTFHSGPHLIQSDSFFFLLTNVLTHFANIFTNLAPQCTKLQPPISSIWLLYIALLFTIFLFLHALVLSYTNLVSQLHRLYPFWLLLCHTMACFERDLHTLISGGDHVVLAIYRSYL